MSIIATIYYNRGRLIVLIDILIILWYNKKYVVQREGLSIAKLESLTENELELFGAVSTKQLINKLTDALTLLEVRDFKLAIVIDAALDIPKSAELTYWSESRMLPGMIAHKERHIGATTKD